MSFCLAASRRLPNGAPGGYNRALRNVIQKAPVPMRWIVRHKLLLILVLCVVLRLGVYALFPSTFAFDQTGVIHGSTSYDDYARNLLATGVYGRIEPGLADSELPPLYSYFLAGVYGVFGRSSLAVAVAHTALDALTLVALFHFVRRIFPRGEAVGLLAALFFACYPYLVFQNLTVIDTPLYMALLYGFLALAAVLRERTLAGRRMWALGLATGLVLGLGALVRPNILLIAPLVGVWFWFRLPLRTALVRLAPVAVISALVLVPWVARGYALYGQFVPIGLNGGPNFYQGNNPYTLPYIRAGYDVQWVPSPEFTDVAPTLPARDRAFMAAGMDFLRENPQLIPELLWAKLGTHWSIDIMPLRNPAPGQTPRIDYQGNVIAETDSSGGLSLGQLPPGDPVSEYSSSTFDAGRIIHRWYFGPLLLLALAGSLLALPHWRDVSLIWMVQLITTVTYVLLHSSTRYRAPTDPLLFAFSAYALMWSWAALQARRGQRAQTEPSHAA